MARHGIDAAMALVLFLSLAGCQPYESQTLEMGERGIQPVLSQAETSDAGQDEARRAAQQRSERDMRERTMRDAVERQKATAPSWVPPWPDEAETNRQGGIGSNFPPTSESSAERRAPVQSPQFEACVARYTQHKRELDRYGKAAPAYVMVHVNVGEPPQQVSCSQIKFYSRMEGEKALVYSRYLKDCEPLRASGPVYEVAKAKADQTQQECFAIARRAGISPGEARSRLR